jgi:LPXTG-site transpeptidase (sortase) family protein
MRDSIQRQRTKKRFKKTNNILLIVAIALFVVGIVFLLIDPIKNAKRKTAVSEGLDVLESQMSAATTVEGDTSETEEISLTLVVDANANAVDGEEYDYFGDGEGISVEDELAGYEGSVTLNGIGIIEIDSIDLRLPVWDTASVVALRYGAGHYENSVMPGEVGNCAILGHHMRDYGSMFNRLGEVQSGDIIRIQTADGNTYEYCVDSIVTIQPEDLEARISGNYFDTARITLVTCTYSGEATLRLIVSGYLIDDQG